MKYQAFGKKENCWKMFGKIVKTADEAVKEAETIFKITNAEVVGYITIPTKRGERVNFVDLCKRQPKPKLEIS